MIVVPVALVLIFSLLYMTYGNIVDTVRVFTGIPFAWTGGIIALWLRDMPFSISAAVGFVALSGVAVLDDMLLVSCIRQLREKGVALEKAVEQAALTRLRPGVDDDTRRRSRFHSDGDQYGNGRRSSTTARHGRDRRRHQRDGDVVAWCCECFTWFFKVRCHR